MKADPAPTANPNAGDIRVHNVTVPHGPARVQHHARVFADQVEKALADGRTAVKVKADLVREEYPNWTPVEHATAAPEPSGTS